MTSRPIPAKELAQLATLFSSGRFDEMERHAQRLLRKFPAAAILWKALGIAQLGRERPADAVPALERAVKLDPNDAETLSNCAHALAGVGRAQEAEQNFRRALALNAALPNAWSGLGHLLAQRGRFDDAVDALQRAVTMTDSPHVMNRLANVLREAGRLQEARTAYEAAIARAPGVADFHANLGVTLGQAGELPAAAASLRHALELAPERADIHSNLGLMLGRLGELAQAEAVLRRGIALAPQRASLHTNLGNLLKDSGRLREACDSYRAALACDPDFMLARSNLLVALNYIGPVAAETALAEAKKFGEWARQRVPANVHTRRSPRATGALRVGFVSGDLRVHPVGYFLEGVLGPLKSAGLELFAYPTVHTVDALTKRIQPHFTRWECISGLGDRDAARRIDEDGIDILVDLAGHTSQGRLTLFAWRPAPVQVSWLGYFATTGLAEMDWVLADETSVPAGCDKEFVERVWRLPRTRLCFDPPRDAPDVAPPPVVQNRVPTFGSFQPLSKINDDVIGAWASVLAASAGARLRLQNMQLGDDAARGAVRTRLAAAGIDPARVELHGPVPRTEYLALHSKVDLLLDTFPFPGGTTTCEALWMGVPTVTLAGSTMLARQGASLMHAARAGEWVVNSVDAYVARAIDAAQDVEALARFRGGCRERLRLTPLFDAQAFAKDVYAAFTQMAGRR